jgi:hypothetical protein
MFRESIKKAVKSDNELIRNTELVKLAYNDKDFIDREDRYYELVELHKQQLRNDIATIGSIHLNGFETTTLKLCSEIEDIHPELVFMISENLKINGHLIGEMIQESDDQIQREHPNLGHRKIEDLMNTALKEKSFFICHKKDDYGDFKISLNPLCLLRDDRDQWFIKKIEVSDLI